MNKRVIIIILTGLLSCTINLFAQELETELFNLPDVSFKQLSSTEEGNPVYELRVKQPIDHTRPDKGFFYQRVFLTHLGFDSCTVMKTSGYTQSHPAYTEVSRILHANQLSVEHRYFGESCPDTLDYTYLTLEQAMADLHKINQLFRQIYKGKWLSTGASKGGATTVFYRYFYPEDVDVSVPYVAPVNTEFEETRIYAFLDTIGSEECRNAIETFQIRMLSHRDEVLPLLKMYALGADLEFTYLSLEEAFEYAVMEYPFAFWQYGTGCDEIPPDSTDLETAVAHFLEVSLLFYFSDKGINYYLSHYYQSATQMGYYSYRTEKFRDYLKVLPTDRHPTAALVPDNIPTQFDGSLLKKVNQWLKTEGNGFIYIYGANDTWTASAVPPSDKTNSVWIFVKGMDHHASIESMSPEQQDQVIQTLENWLGRKIENPYAGKE